MLNHRRILVTGATGFIGRRLAERLAKENGATVTGVGRQLEKVHHLRDLGVHLIHLDLRDEDGLAGLLRGHDIVFHLAAASSAYDPETCYEINVRVTERLVREASAAGVSRFVHVSSITAYGSAFWEVMHEERPLATDQPSAYGRTKAIGEQRAMEIAGELGIEATALRPGMVYGPYGRSWTVNLFNLVKKGVPVIFGGGHGHAHPIFVDNLIDGMLLVASRPEAVGEAFNFFDGPLPWRDFFGYYGAMCGRKPRSLPLWLAKPVMALVKPFIGRTEPTEVIYHVYTNRSVYPIDKAERLLGYSPRFSFQEGMSITKAWLVDAGHLPANNERSPQR
jgi:nucleoside-diphosphate-sugar epimerase